MMIASSAPGRAGHILLHYLPMIVLGMVFLIVGLSPTAPHVGVVPLGNLFLLLAMIMLVGAFLGLLFTRCPRCFVRWRKICLYEPDIFWDERVGDYYRDLVPENGGPD